MPHKLDTRLDHLIKLQRQADRDVRSYVKNKWPKGKKIKYILKGVECEGEVASHHLESITISRFSHHAVTLVPFKLIRK